jgi:hypothetical protein
MQSPSRRALLGILGTLPLTACLDSDSSGTLVSETPTDSSPTDRTATRSANAYFDDGETTVILRWEGGTRRKTVRAT